MPPYCTIDGRKSLHLTGTLLISLHNVLLFHKILMIKYLCNICHVPWEIKLIRLPGSMYTKNFHTLSFHFSVVIWLVTCECEYESQSIGLRFSCTRSSYHKLFLVFSIVFLLTCAVMYIISLYLLKQLYIQNAHSPSLFQPIPCNISIEVFSSRNLSSITKVQKISQALVI